MVEVPTPFDEVKEEGAKAKSEDKEESAPTPMFLPLFHLLPDDPHLQALCFFLIFHHLIQM